MIICRVCKENKSDTSFFKSKGHIDRICKVCKNNTMKTRRQQFKLWAVEYKGGKCIKCGYDKYVGALDFHHRDPSIKDSRIDYGNLIEKEKAKIELNKCDLLCRNCHAEVHNEMRS